MSKKIATDIEITWCPGCGNFGILNAFKKTISKLEKKKLKKEDIVLTTGIGCHGKIFDYINISGIYSLHGRSIATAQGLKLGNPSLKVIAFCGDGDSYGEGIAHLIFAAKRNMDITVIVHNNGTYALTTGQFSPTSQRGFKGPSMPKGSIEHPINPLSLMLEVGASFVARGYAGDIDHLSNILTNAIMHPGFSIVDILQPSVVFNNTYELYNDVTEKIEKPVKKIDEAMSLVKQTNKKIPIGIFFKTTKSVFHEELYQNRYPLKNRSTKKKRLDFMKQYLSPSK